MRMMLMMRMIVVVVSDKNHDGMIGKTCHMS